MSYVLLSILVLTLIIYALRSKLPFFSVCAICAGVTLTWIWLLGGIWLGYLASSSYEFITAILMGATIGGIVTELKKLFAKIQTKKKTESKEVEKLKDMMNDCC